MSAKYNSLEQLSAGKFLKQEKHPNEGKNPIEDVSSIISFQNSLRNVRLYGYFGYSSATETLMSCLSKLVKQPQLESLMIEGYNRNCRVSMEMFSKIILHFLLNETSHYQNLTFTNFELFDTKLTSLKMATLSHSLSKVPSCNLKSLDISSIRLPMEVVRMLNRIEPCCFDVLALSLDSTTGYYTELSKFCNSVKYILTLNLDKHSLTIDEDVIAKQVAHFIAKPTIQSLVLNFISLSYNCEIVSQTFSSVASNNHSLNVIHFNHCFSGINMESLELMFHSLIELAQKVDLELKFEEDFSMKFMSRDHVAVLNRAWISFTSTYCGPPPVRRIYKLECSLFNAGEDVLLKMMDVVENICLVFKSSDK